MELITNINCAELKKIYNNEYGNKDNPNLFVDFLSLSSDDIIPLEIKNQLSNNLCMFHIWRQAHRNIIFEDEKNTYINYCNYFLNFYDEDKEFLSGLLFVKRTIDKSYRNNIIQIFNYEYFTNQFVLKILLNNKILDSLHRMVLDNNVHIIYDSSICKNGEEVIKFDKLHVDLLHVASLACKLLMPLINHYLYLSKNISINMNGELHNFNKFIIQTVTDYFERYYNIRINIFQKLNYEVSKRVEKHINKNKAIYDKFMVYGKNNANLISKILDTIYTNALLKYIFEGNIINLNIGFINNICENELRFNSVKLVQEIDEIEKDNDGLSKLDKLEIDLKKDDESKIIITKVAINSTLERLKQKYGDVSEEEIQYYIDNIDMSKKMQVSMVQLYFSKEFGSTLTMKFLKIHQYATLIAIMMRMMEERGYYILQYILTGKIIGTVRKSINSKAYQRIEPRIENIIKYKYSKNKNTILKSKVIHNILTFALFTNMELISYDNLKMRGYKIDTNRPSDDIIIEEVLRFISEI